MERNTTGPVNNCAHQTSPRPPSAGVLLRSTAGRRVLGSTKPALPARFSSLLSAEPHNQKTKNKAPRASRTARQKYQIYFRT
jgi:hypothetical protein